MKRNDNDQIYTTDRWTRYQWDRFADSNHPSYGTDLYSFPRFAREVFARLYGTPDALDKTRPEDAWAVKAHAELDQHPDFASMRVRCHGDRARAGQATLAICKGIAANLPANAGDARDPQALRDEVSKLMAFASQKPAEIEALKSAGKSAVAANTAVANALDSSDVRSAIRKACDATGREFDSEDEYSAAFGCGGDGSESPEGTDSDAKRALAKAVAQSPKLRKIAELAGRLKRIASQKQKSKADYARSEITDIETGNDLGRLLPSELSKLTDENRKLEFMRGYFERSLLQYKLSGREEQARGPIVVCIDESGSMRGQSEVWSKAFALALVQIAQSQHRAVDYIRFGAVARHEATWGPKEVDPESVVGTISQFMCADDTVFKAPLNLAMERIGKAETMRKADIVFITDGLAPLSEEWIADFNAKRKAHGISVYAIAIGTYQHSPIESVSDKVVYLHDVASDIEACNLLDL